MLLLITGIAIFFGAHLLPTRTGLREQLRIRFGAKPYELGFIVASVVGLGLMAYGYASVQYLPGKNPVIWSPPAWSKHVAWLLMLPSAILLAAAYIPSRIRDAVGHPMLLATKVWAFAHLFANGRLAAVLLFGSFLAWAVIDLISVKRRGAKGPLGARRGTLGGDLVAATAGTEVYTFMMVWGHAKLIGVALIPSVLGP
jgi:uncharacterized membrane protein